MANTYLMSIALLLLFNKTTGSNIEGVVAVANSSITLKCYLTRNETCGWNFSKDLSQVGHPLFSAGQTHDKEQSFLLTNDGDICHLTIYNVSGKHDGVYTCPPLPHRQIRLFVKPLTHKMSNGNGNIRVKQIAAISGELLQLRCRTDGTHRVDWYHIELNGTLRKRICSHDLIGKSFESMYSLSGGRHGVHDLIIKNVTASSTTPGFYECVDRGGTGPTITLAEVNVYDHQVSHGWRTAAIVLVVLLLVAGGVATAIAISLLKSFRRKRNSEHTTNNNNAGESEKTSLRQHATNNSNADESEEALQKRDESQSFIQQRPFGEAERDFLLVTKDPELYEKCVVEVFEHIQEHYPAAEIVVGFEFNGYLFSTIVANRLRLSFIPIAIHREHSQYLPDYNPPIVTANYTNNFGKNAEMEMRKVDWLKDKEVVIVGDTLRYGSATSAAVDLLHQQKAKVLGCCVIYELKNYGGRVNFQKRHSKIQLSSIQKVEVKCEGSTNQSPFATPEHNSPV